MVVDAKTFTLMHTIALCSIEVERINEDYVS